MWYCFSLTTMALASFLTVGIGPLRAEEPSARDLINLAPNLRSSDPKLRALEVGGHIRHGVARMKFQAIYRAPDRYSLVIRGTDGTPLLFATDRKILVYDPVGAVVLLATDTSTDFSIWQDEDTLKFRIGLLRRKGSRSSVELDIKSLLRAPSQEQEVAKTPEGSYCLTLTSIRGNRLVFGVDPRRRSAFTRIQLIPKDEEPFVSVDRIVIDGSPGDECFAFPSNEALLRRIEVRQWAGDGFMDDADSLAYLFRAAYARMAADDPMLRDAIKIPGQPVVDWDKLKRSDKTYSQAIKAMVPPDREAR